MVGIGLQQLEVMGELHLKMGELQVVLGESHLVMGELQVGIGLVMGVLHHTTLF